MLCRRKLTNTKSTYFKKCRKFGGTRPKNNKNWALSTRAPRSGYPSATLLQATNTTTMARMTVATTTMATANATITMIKY